MEEHEADDRLKIGILIVTIRKWLEDKGALIFENGILVTTGTDAAKAYAKAYLEAEKKKATEAEEPTVVPTKGSGGTETSSVIELAEAKKIVADADKIMNEAAKILNGLAKVKDEADAKTSEAAINRAKKSILDKFNAKMKELKTLKAKAIKENLTIGITKALKTSLENSEINKKFYYTDLVKKGSKKFVV